MMPFGIFLFQIPDPFSQLWAFSVAVHRLGGYYSTDFYGQISQNIAQ
jgi:hypothetical protein